MFRDHDAIGIRDKDGRLRFDRLLVIDFAAFMLAVICGDRQDGSIIAAAVVLLPLLLLPVLLGCWIWQRWRSRLAG